MAKTDSGYRVIALDDDTVGVVKRHREYQEADPTARSGSAWVDTGLVFTQEGSSWLHPGKVSQRSLGPARRRVGSSAHPAARPAPRRGHLHARAASIDLKVVSDTLGHSDTRITRDIHQSVLPQVGENIAAAIAKLVPLQRKSEAEQAAREAAKAAEKVKKKAKPKVKGKKKGKQKKPKE